MKTNFRKFFKVLAIVAVASTALLASCHDDEVSKTPEIVEGGALTELGYYITGVVTSSGDPLSGVTVAIGNVEEKTGSDGTYEFKVTSTENTAVSFSMDGYVGVSATAVFTSTENGTTVILSQELTKTVTATTVTASDISTDTTFTFSQSSSDEGDTGGDTTESTAISVTIVASTTFSMASEEGGETDTVEEISLSATVFVPAAEEANIEAVNEKLETIVATDDETADADAVTEVEVSTSSTLTALDLQPDGITFSSPVTVSIPASSTTDYFENATHVKYNESTGTWDNEGSATYKDGAYDITVSGFSQHGVQISSTVTLSKSTEVETKEFDNIGKTSATSGTFTYTQKSGWIIDESNSDTDSTAYSEMESYVNNYMGTTAGETDIEASRTISVSGDEKVTVTATQSLVIYKFKFTLSSGDKYITVKSYGSLSLTTESETGDLTTDHNSHN